MHLTMYNQLLLLIHTDIYFVYLYMYSIYAYAWRYKFYYLYLNLNYLYYIFLIVCVIHDLLICLYKKCKNIVKLAKSTL